MVEGTIYDHYSLPKFSRNRCTITSVITYGGLAALGLYALRRGHLPEHFAFPFLPLVVLERYQWRYVEDSRQFLSNY